MSSKQLYVNGRSQIFQCIDKFLGVKCIFYEQQYLYFKFNYCQNVNVRNLTTLIILMFACEYIRIISVAINWHIQTTLALIIFQYPIGSAFLLIKL